MEDSIDKERKSEITNDMAREDNCIYQTKRQKQTDKKKDRQKGKSKHRQRETQTERQR